LIFSGVLAIGGGGYGQLFQEMTVLSCLNQRLIGLRCLAPYLLLTAGVLPFLLSLTAGATHCICSSLFCTPFRSLYLALIRSTTSPKTHDSNSANGSTLLIIASAPGEAIVIHAVLPFGMTMVSREYSCMYVTILIKIQTAQGIRPIIKILRTFILMS